MTDLAPLYSLEAERSVLGGLLFRPGLIGTLPIQTEDFFSPKHQVIWQAMVSLDESGSPVDTTTVAGEVRRMGRMGAFGGDEMNVVSFLGELTLSCPSAENVAHYVKTELHRYARKRQMVTLYAETLHKLKTSDIADFEDLRTESLLKLQGLDDNFEDPGRYLSSLIADEVQAIQKHLDGGSEEWTTGMPTGIQQIDQNIGGLPTGVTTLILGETGAGKSSLAMQLARAAVTIANDRPMVISYEDAFKSYARRGLAQESGVSTQRIGSRRFREGEAQKVIVDGIRNLGHRREKVYRFRTKGMDEVCQLVKRVRAKGPEAGAKSVGRLVILDYFQAVRVPRGMDHVQGLAENARMLEDLADQEDIAVVILGQVNDNPKERKGIIELFDVRGGRDVAIGCKLAFGLYRPFLYDKNADETYGELLVLKNNPGQTQKHVKLKLALETHTIRDFDP